MKKTVRSAAIMAIFMASASSVFAQASTELPLYGDKTPGSAKSEVWQQMGPLGRGVRNVSRPSLTLVLPDPAKATGAAAVVAPGGGFMILAWEHEGTRIARALADRGIAAFILKYRLSPTPVDEREAGGFIGSRLSGAQAGGAATAPRLEVPKTIAEDGLAALRMVRANAQRWGVDAKRVGMIGFSAGAITTLATVQAAKPGEGPDFIGYIYGPQSAVPVPADAPPMFDAITFDDEYFSPTSFPLVENWVKAKRPVELHVYGKGRHGFGTGVPGTTTTLFLDEFTAWLSMQGFLTKAKAP